MLADGNNERPDVHEQYDVACGQGSGRNVVGAAGMALNPEGQDEPIPGSLRAGMALLRLHSEFSGAAKPQRLTAAQIGALAETFKAADDAERTNRDRENGELERLRGLLSEMDAEAEGRLELVEKVVELESLYERGYLPLPAIKGTGGHQVRARAHAAKWYANELRIFAQSLNSRPTVWSHLLPWAQAKGIPEDHVAQALFHWLDPVCGHCDGHGLHKAKDAPALSAKQCRACNGTGTKAVQQEVEGDLMRVLSYLSHCTSQARTSIQKRLREGR